MDVHLSAEIWAIVGIALIIADILTATFVLVFFGIGALITALTTWIGLTRSIELQLIIFPAISVISMILFRKTAKRLFGKGPEGPEYSEFIGEKAKVTVTIPPHGEGRVSYRGTEWIAYSENGSTIPEGSSVTIIDVDGIKFRVRKTGG